MTAVLGAQLAFGAWSMTPSLGVRHSYDADLYLGTGCWAVTCFVPLVSVAALLLKLLLAMRSG